MTATHKQIVIIKLGGAAITDKKGICQLAPTSQLDKLLDQIKQAYDLLTASGHQMVLVHGAGSFGHPQAKQYQLKNGWRNTCTTTYLKGYSHIRSCLQQLSHSIISRLESRHVPVLAMSPIDYIETIDCEATPTVEFENMASRVKQYLKLGFVPVLHGDAVLDRTRGCTILSGDIIMYQLTRLLLNVSRCIFITDVNGIYQHDPKSINQGDENLLISRVLIDHHQEEEEVVRVVALEEQQQQQQQLAAAATAADVTGGMQGKMKWAKMIVSSSGLQHDNNNNNKIIDTIICKWGSKEALDMMTLQSAVATEDKDYAMTLFTTKK